MFFEKKHIYLAKSFGRRGLSKLYRESEDNLVMYANMQNEKALQKEMNNHQLYEYALLYTYTPEYKQMLARQLSKSAGCK